MRKRRLSVLLTVAAMLVAMLALGGAALALPSETPDDTLMVDGRVRAIEQVGTNVWVGGNFSKVMQPNGTSLNVSNVAVFDSETDKVRDIAPKLGGTSSTVWDIELYSNNVLIAVGNRTLRSASYFRFCAYPPYDGRTCATDLSEAEWTYSSTADR